MDYFEKSRRQGSVVVDVIVPLAMLILLFSAVRFIGRATTQKEGGCGTENLGSRIAWLLKEKPRFIAVVGDGVPGESLVVDRPYNTQFAQGYDLYQGVQHALGAPELKSVLESVGVLYIDDGGNPACAKGISEILAVKPQLMGVIGHSTTSCTKEALPAYARSNIPVIIPAATNPDLLSEKDRSFFRLPSNDKIQALVIADVVITQLNASSVFVVWDATPEALQYSEYLKSHIQHHLSTGELGRATVIEGSYPISLSPLNYSYLFRRIVSSEADVVVFAGYGSLAREFLLGLDAEYSQYREQVRPKIILTDGCKIPGINGYGFDTYLTFSASPLSTFSTFKEFKRGEKIARFEKMYLEESFEVFGYDAGLMLLGAMDKINSRDQSVSREHIVQFIGAGNEMNLETSYPYNFEGGDNTRHRYYCYSLASDSIKYAYDEEAINSLLRRVSMP